LRPDQTGRRLRWPRSGSVRSGWVQSGTYCLEQGGVDRTKLGVFIAGRKAVLLYLPLHI